MQKRYCLCGCPVWVEYDLSAIDCRAIFRSTGEMMKPGMTACPHCGTPLDINELS